MSQSLGALKYCRGIVADARQFTLSIFSPYAQFRTWRDVRAQRAYDQERVDELSRQFTGLICTMHRFEERVSASLEGKLCFVEYKSDGEAERVVRSPDPTMHWPVHEIQGGIVYRGGRAGYAELCDGTLPQLNLVHSFLNYAREDLACILAQEVVKEQPTRGKVRLNNGLTFERKWYSLPRSLNNMQHDKLIHNYLGELSTVIDATFQLVAKHCKYVEDDKSYGRLRAVVRKRLHNDGKDELADLLHQRFYDNDTMRRFSNYLRNPMMHGDPRSRHEGRSFSMFTIDGPTTSRYSMRTFIELEDGKREEYVTGVLLRSIFEHVVDSTAAAIELLYKDLPAPRRQVFVSARAASSHAARHVNGRDGYSASAASQSL
jgi:hypothetical protein